MRGPFSFVLRSFRVTFAANIVLSRFNRNEADYFNVDKISGYFFFKDLLV